MSPSNNRWNFTRSRTWKGVGRAVFVTFTSEWRGECSWVYIRQHFATFSPHFGLLSHSINMGRYTNSKDHSHQPNEVNNSAGRFAHTNKRPVSSLYCHAQCYVAFSQTLLLSHRNLTWLTALTISKRELWYLMSLGCWIDFSRLVR